MIFGVHVCPNTRRLVNPIFKTFLFAIFSELFMIIYPCANLKFYIKKNSLVIDKQAI